MEVRRRVSALLLAVRTLNEILPSTLHSTPNRPLEINDWIPDIHNHVVHGNKLRLILQQAPRCFGGLSMDGSCKDALLYDLLWSKLH